MQKKVVVLGGNFAGLGAAQKIKAYSKDDVSITVIDRKSYLLYVPNIPAEVLENRNPELSLTMDIRKVLHKEHIDFIQAEITQVDPIKQTVTITPNERPGAEPQTIDYDYLVIAVGAKLAYDHIEGFAEYGDTVSDFYHGNKLRKKLHDGTYKGGPIVVTSARFHQGDGADGLAPYPGGTIPQAMAACEGPPVEISLGLADWLVRHKMGDASKISLVTPGKMIAEDAGEKVVTELLDTASKMGFKYYNNVQDVVKLTKDSIVFANGLELPAELKIVFPDWVAHDFVKNIEHVADSKGFVITDLLMRNPTYKNIFAAGDCAAVTMPKLGAIGHQECEIIGRQIALDLGHMSADKANEPLKPVVFCIGDIGSGKGFYIRSDSWFGGETQVLKMGRIPYMLKMQYKDIFFNTDGKVPVWGEEVARILAEDF
ncbi:NAD(P)/FAD-dependent oxidoreductase [Wohlfahrtiimonas chitiniclastica]|uniref:NAD(P)/FAD-dependent oxidoreductase n=1 Tax=Wohlfahrtiimonas chitiniclastica TaxID=400946 RepID=UPI000B986716|nr:FAD-dependent oxidoreductase [Wohlfahrtiimonas chitiniclastica]MBS7835641.1 FAD-dependent oxidoreductase [Wohlfahrtiimonas chitiniclastica]OYQ85643.1 pyridine nucleotide-disulfide oxidoreductase [Wohlfahrtiimonas chitiniclastica]OYQ86121.1 pyridine nucleotide-disulfide oxidoreductase [Wohlfahrtiimonas chitiniclastica]